MPKAQSTKPTAIPRPAPTNGKQTKKEKSAAMSKLSLKRWNAPDGQLVDEAGDAAAMAADCIPSPHVAVGSQRSKRSCRSSRERSAISPFDPCSSGLTPSPSLNRLVTASAPRAVACGTRLVDMTLLQSALGPHLRCPECLMTGGLVIGMCEEGSAGKWLARDLRRVNVVSMPS